MELQSTADYTNNSPSEADPVTDAADTAKARAQAAKDKLRSDSEASKRRIEERRRTWMTDPLRAAARLVGIDPDLSDEEIRQKLDACQEQQAADRATAKAEDERRMAPYREEQRRRFAEQLFKKSDCPDRHGLNLDGIDGENAQWIAVRDLLYNQAGYAAGFLVALLGPRGTGKTQLAVSVIDACCKRLMTCRYVKALDLFRDLRRAYGQAAPGEHSQREDDIVAKWAAYDLLVIDEAHQRGQTPWEQNTLVNLLDQRYDARRCTIIIANQSKEEFAAEMGASIVSRIHETGEAITCDWQSYRKPGSWKERNADRTDRDRMGANPPRNEAAANANATE